MLASPGGTQTLRDDRPGGTPSAHSDRFPPLYTGGCFLPHFIIYRGPVVWASLYASCFQNTHKLARAPIHPEPAYPRNPRTLGGMLPRRSPPSCEAALEIEQNKGRARTGTGSGFLASPFSLPTTGIAWGSSRPRWPGAAHRGHVRTSRL